MSKELEKSKGTEVGMAQDLGADADLSIRDCPLGRLTILQSQSNLVKSEQGKQGTIVNAADPGVVLGDKTKDVEFIIIATNKYWVTTDPETLDFVGKKPAVHKSEFPYEETMNGRKVKNTYNLSFFVVLPSEIKEGFALPMEIPFRSSTLKFGEQLALQIKRMGAKQIPSWAKVFSIGINPEMGKKGKNSWYLPTIKTVRDATPDEMKVAIEYRAAYATLVEKSMSAKEEDYEGGHVEEDDSPKQF